MAWNNEVDTALTSDDQKIAALEKRVAALENSIAGKVDNVSYDELVDVVGICSASESWQTFQFELCVGICSVRF